MQFSSFYSNFPILRRSISKIDKLKNIQNDRSSARDASALYRVTLGVLRVIHAPWWDTILFTTRGIIRLTTNLRSIDVMNSVDYRYYVQIYNNLSRNVTLWSIAVVLITRTVVRYGTIVFSLHSFWWAVFPLPIRRSILYPINNKRHNRFRAKTDRFVFSFFLKKNSYTNQWKLTNILIFLNTRAELYNNKGKKYVWKLLKDPISRSRRHARFVSVFC